MRPTRLGSAAAARLGLALTVTLAIAGTAAAQVASLGVAGFHLRAFDGLAGDFNGGGYDDLATGFPGSDGLAVHPVEDCDALVARFGARWSDLDTDSVDSALGQFGAATPDPLEVGDAFGAALVASDFDEPLWPRPAPYRARTTALPSGSHYEKEATS